MSTGEIGSWSERQRLMFIERVLYWRGWINRKDLMEHFGTSAPQATNDLTAYTGINPGGCLYNVRRKRYEAAARMKPVLIEPNMAADFAAMGAAVEPHEGVPFVAYPEMPLRSAAPDVLRRVVSAAYRDVAVEIRYCSLNSGTSLKRWISPRAFVNDGLRWHVRAYCHKRERFGDFVVGRIEKLGSEEPSPYTELVDVDWVTYVDLVIRPNPAMDAIKRRALEMDYGMQEGQWRLRVRKAMLFYTMRRLGFVKKRGQLPMLNEVKELELMAVEA